MLIARLTGFVFSYAARLYLLLAYCVFTGTFLYLICKKTAAGSLQRIFASVLVVLGNCVVLNFFDVWNEVVTACAVFFLLMWLSTFKIAGLCTNRGPLCQPLEYMQFLAVLWLPITPQLVVQSPLSKAVSMAKRSPGRMPRVTSNARLGEAAGSSRELLAGFLAKGITLGVVIYCLNSFSLHRVAKECLYAVGMYAFLGLLMDGPASLAASLIGMRIAPHFDKPYLSSSLMDFWSRRWNLTAGNALRFLVYDPIVERSLIKTNKPCPRPGVWLRRLGVAATFMVSAIVHELIMWYAVGYKPGATGGWFTFFAIQGPLLAVESVLVKWARKRRLTLPRWAAIPLTLFVAMALGDLYFFRPAIDSGLADRVVESLRETYQSMWDAAAHRMRHAVQRL